MAKKRDQAAWLAQLLTQAAATPVTVAWEADSVGRGVWRVRWADGPAAVTLQAQARIQAPFLKPLDVTELRWGRAYTPRAWAHALTAAAADDPRITDWHELLGIAESWLDDTEFPGHTPDPATAARVDQLLAHHDGRESSMAQTLLTTTVTQPVDETRCPVCGRPMPHHATGRPAQYCSPTCRTRAWRTRQPVTKHRDETACTHCGRPVPGGGVGRPAQYCSPACRTRAWRARRTENVTQHPRCKPRSTS